MVIETNHKVAYLYRLSPDGLSATIDAPGLAKPGSLPAPLAPLKGIDAALQAKPERLQLTLSFATPVRLAHTLDLADPNGTRFRLALDYAPLGAALENLAPATGDAKTASLPPASEPAVAQPPAPPWANGSAPASLPATSPPAASPATPSPAASSPLAPDTPRPPAAAGPSGPASAPSDHSFVAALRSVQFGANEGTLNGVIAATFGANATLAHGGSYNPQTHERKTFVSITAPFDDLGPAHGLYYFAPPTGALGVVIFDWTGTSGGLSDDDRDRQIERLTAALLAAGFHRAPVAIDTAPPAVGWLAFAGSDGAGRAGQIWVIPTVLSTLPAAADPGADSDALVRYIVRLALAPLNGAPTKADAAR